MMALSTIRQISRDAAIRAARENRIPFTVEPQDLVDWKAQFEAGTLKFPFPFLGDYVPQGWRRTDRDPLFADSTGHGREGEAALTVRATIEALIPGKAYAIIEGGQFQLYLGEYERDDDSPGNENEFVGLTSTEEAEFGEVVEQESQFDPAKMSQLVRKLQQEGRMPPVDEYLRAVDEERERVQNLDFEIRDEGEFLHFMPLTRPAADFIAKHVQGAVFDEFGALVLDRLMGEMVVWTMRREGLRVA